MEASTCRARSGLVLAGLLVVPLLGGASHRSENFVVEAPTAEIARRVGQQAETCRLRIAKEWLGHELPRWSQPCPIKVKVTNGEAGGLTSFGFHRGKVSDQEMSVEGRLERILASAIPHEVTHTVLAAHFGAPMPRWADEGAALLSEDDRELRRHDEICSRLVSRRGELPLVRLFAVEEYPQDLLGFYGQGYSTSRFLVEMGGKPRFLRFISDGGKLGWDQATQRHYGLADVRELDRAWRAWHLVVAENKQRSDTVTVNEAIGEGQ